MAQERLHCWPSRTGVCAAPRSAPHARSSQRGREKRERERERERAGSETRKGGLGGGVGKLDFCEGRGKRVFTSTTLACQPYIGAVL